MKNIYMNLKANLIILVLTIIQDVARDFPEEGETPNALDVMILGPISHSLAWLV